MYGFQGAVDDADKLCLTEELFDAVMGGLRPTLAKPTLAILIFRLWPNPTLAKPTLADCGQF